jgi:hypothetical protein
MNHTSTQEIKHLEILRDFTFNTHANVQYKRKKISRTRTIIESDGVSLPQLKEEYVSAFGRVLYPEFIEYAYLLEGCTKKLFYYLVFHQVDIDTCEFKFNDQMIFEFNSYNAVKGVSYTTATVKSAKKKLVEHNIIVNLKRGAWMMNPMIIGGKSVDQRRRLINVYSDLLLYAGKSVSTKFYPVYVA